MTNPIQLTERLILIGVPKTAFEFKISGDNLIYRPSPILRSFHFEPLPEGNYKVLGTVTKDEVSFDTKTLYVFKNINIF